jgi:hypothetical protein
MKRQHALQQNLADLVQATRGAKAAYLLRDAVALPPDGGRRRRARDAVGGVREAGGGLRSGEKRIGGVGAQVLQDLGFADVVLQHNCVREQCAAQKQPMQMHQLPA